ncbi:MAG: F0F1 ATP synthase subunit B [Bacteroidales bacterium]|nr:F0F1 ATP synthase subunit B [Bacteroidales bacterium]
MNLVTPDGGLLFWMTLIFLLLFFILAKFGFPIITGMVDKRNRHIDESLRLASEAEERMQNLAREQAELLEKTRAEQTGILREAARTRENIISQAKSEAAAQAAKMLEKAKTEIAAEKESALRDIRKEVAMIAVDVAEKVLRDKLSTQEAQSGYVGRLVDEYTQKHRS